MHVMQTRSRDSKDISLMKYFCYSSYSHYYKLYQGHDFAEKHDKQIVDQPIEYLNAIHFLAFPVNMVTQLKDK